MSLFNLIYNICISILITSYCFVITDKHSIVLRLLCSFITGLLYFSYVSYIQFFHINIGNILCIIFILSLLYLLFFWDGQNLLKIQHAIFIDFIVTIVNVYCTLIHKSIPLHDFSHEYLLKRKLMIYTFEIVISYILIFLYLRQNKKQTNSYFAKISIIILLMILLIIVHILDYSVIDIYAYLEYKWMLLVFISNSCFFLFFMQKKSNEYYSSKLKDEYEKELLKQELALNKKYLQSQEELHSLKHDLQHLLNAIYETDSSRPKEILNRMLNAVDTISIPFDTGNKTLDRLLSIKKETAENKNITFICTVNIDKEIPLSNDDLTLLMINILDNAIMHIGNGLRIEVFIKNLNENLSIQVSNSLRTPLELTGDIIKIPKNSNNTYGIKTIQKIVNKYNGLLSYTQDNDTLTCKVVIPLN